MKLDNDYLDMIDKEDIERNLEKFNVYLGDRMYFLKGFKYEII